MKTEATAVDILEKTYQYDESFSYFEPTVTDAYLERAKRVYDFEKENGLLGGEFDLKELYQKVSA